jgi:hypothetical protein
MLRLVKQKRQEGKIYRFSMWEGKTVIEMTDLDFKWHPLPLLNK